MIVSTRAAVVTLLVASGLGLVLGMAMSPRIETPRRPGDAASGNAVTITIVASNTAEAQDASRP